MAKQIVRAKDFKDVVSEGFWIADFYTDTCGPCKLVDRVIDDIIFDDPTINVAKCNLVTDPEYKDEYKVTVTPTLFFMYDGEIKEQVVGYLPKNKMEEKIAEYIYG